MSKSSVSSEHIHIQMILHHAILNPSEIYVKFIINTPLHQTAAGPCPLLLLILHAFLSEWITAKLGFHGKRERAFITHTEDYIRYLSGGQTVKLTGTDGLHQVCLQLNYSTRAPQKKKKNFLENWTTFFGVYVPHSCLVLAWFARQKLIRA